MARYEVTCCSDPELWDGFLRGSPHRSIFAGTEWLKAVDVRYECWMVWSGSQPWVGALILLDDRGPVRAPYSFCLYQGLFWGEALASQPWHSRTRNALESTAFLLEELTLRYGRLSFCTHPDFRDIRPLLWLHYQEPERGRFEIDVWYTGLIGLDGLARFDDYLLSIRKTRRQDYRRAQELGCVVEPLDDLDTLEWLYRETFSRQPVTIGPDVVPRMRRIATASRASGSGDVLVCRDSKGTPLSATLFLYDDACGYYLVGANDPAHRATGSGTFLLLESIRRCWERGLRRVDVCGMNSPGRGDFKAGLNAAPVPYFTATWERPTA